MTLIDNGIIYCKDLARDPDILRVLNASKEKEARILELSRQICNGH